MPGNPKQHMGPKDMLRCTAHHFIMHPSHGKPPLPLLHMPPLESWHSH